MCRSTRRLGAGRGGWDASSSPCSRASSATRPAGARSGSGCPGTRSRSLPSRRSCSSVPRVCPVALRQCEPHRQRRNRVGTIAALSHGDGPARHALDGVPEPAAGRRREVGSRRDGPRERGSETLQAVANAGVVVVFVAVAVALSPVMTAAVVVFGGLTRCCTGRRPAGARTGSRDVRPGGRDRRIGDRPARERKVLPIDRPPGRHAHHGRLPVPQVGDSLCPDDGTFRPRAWSLTSPALRSSAPSFW